VVFLWPGRRPAAPPPAALGAVGRGLQDAALRLDQSPTQNERLAKKSRRPRGRTRGSDSRKHPRGVEEILWITARERRRGTKDTCQTRGRDRLARAELNPFRTAPFRKNRGAGGNPNNRGLSSEDESGLRRVWKMRGWNTGPHKRFVDTKSDIDTIYGSHGSLESRELRGKPVRLRARPALPPQL
jgi:hypothetical protein